MRCGSMIDLVFKLYVLLNVRKTSIRNVILSKVQRIKVKVKYKSFFSQSELVIKLSNTCSEDETLRISFGGVEVGKIKTRLKSKKLYS